MSIKVKASLNYTGAVFRSETFPFRVFLCPIHTARQTRQDSAVCVLSGGVN